MAEWQMRFLGSVELAVDGMPLTELKSKKALALLSYLAVTGVEHDRLALATLLWADTPEANARMNLRKVVAVLRESANACLNITNETIALNWEGPCSIDVTMLEQAAARLRTEDDPDLARLQEAVDLYQGDFLAGFHVRNAPLFEEWVLVQQARLRTTALELLGRLAGGYAARGRLDEAIATIRRLLHLEPWREQAHRQLMRYLATSGRRGEALAQFESCRQILAREFGAEPAPATASLFEAIRDETFATHTGRRRERDWAGSLDQNLEESDAGKREPPPPSPYRGLFAFREEDAPFFFGRETIAERLVATARQQPLLAIVGPSGSGKSSLAIAGLVAGLRQAGDWHFCILRPGSQPFRSLAVALLPLLEPALSETDRLVEAGKMARAMRGGTLSLASVVERIAQLNEPTGRLLILVDQFEEVYTLCPDAAVRQRFLGALLNTVQEQRLRKEPATCIGLALRADFMEDALAHRPFADALQEATVILGPMSREELSRAIEQPASIQGVRFEAGLIDRILDDVGAQSGNLPLLQFALTKLWEEEGDWLLTHRAYEAIGRVDGALARYAEDVYAGLADSEKAGVRRVFVQMVRPGGRSEDTRRIALRREFSKPDWALVQRLADTRLLVTGRDSTGRETAELVHEAMILAWGQLRKWLESDRAFRLWQERLRAALRAWQSTGGDEDALLRGWLLAEAEGWMAEMGKRLSPPEAAFIRASQLLRQRKQSERKEARLLQERNRRLVIVGLAGLLAIALGALVLAIGEGRRAEAQARLAFARELTAAATGNLESDPVLSIHLALQAIRTTLEPDAFVLREAEQALHRAVQANRVAFVLPQSGGLAFSPDGTVLAAGGRDGTVAIADLLTGETVKRFQKHSAAVTGLAFRPDGALLAGVSERRHVVVWDVDTGQSVLELPGRAGSGPILGKSTVAFSPDGAFLLVAGPAADTEVWEVATGRLHAFIKESAAPDAAFSPDGRKLALTTAIWELPAALEMAADPAEGDPLALAWSDRLFDFAGAVAGIQDPSSNVSAYQNAGSVAFSPDGERLLLTLISNVAVLVDATSGGVLATLSEHGGIIHSVAFSPDGSRAATASADGTTHIWDTETGARLLSLGGHKDEVTSVAFHPEGNYLATGSLDGQTRVWDISAGDRGEWLRSIEHDAGVLVAFNPEQDSLITIGEDGTMTNANLLTGEAVESVALPGGGVRTLALNRDGTRLALASTFGTIRISEVASGNLLQTLDAGEPVRALAFSPDGRLLAAAGSDGQLALWNIESGDILTSWAIHEHFVNGLAFSPDGDRLASAGADGRGLIMRTDQLIVPEGGGGTSEPGRQLPPEAIIASLIGHGDLIVSLEPAPDGKRLVTASWDGTAIVWNGISGEPLLSLRGHNGQVADAAFTPDGRRIATAGSDGRLILWDATSGEQLFVLASREVPLRSLAFSRDGTYLAAAGVDGSVRLYLSPIEALMNLAEERLTRELTEAECRRYLHVERCPD